MNHTLEQAIDQFRNQAARYRKTRRYYAGEQDLQFASEKFASTFGNLFREFALNLCPAIVDAVRDKLKIEGFGTEEKLATNYTNHTNSEGGTCITREIDRIWRSSRMAIRAGEVHKEALKNGDAYVIVWPASDGRVQIVPQSAEACTVHYDEDEPGSIAWAAKYWRGADKRTRLNLFYSDRIEKYVAEDQHAQFLPDAQSFVETHADGGVRVPNPFGVVPVFHFANNADIGALGRSELDDAMAVQDGLNKSVLDMLVAMEVCSFRQRWIAGIEIRTDQETGKDIPPFKTSSENVWMTESTEARFGEFGASDLEQFLKVKDGFRIDMASVTGTPLYYLMPQIRGFPSGESLRKAETRFLAKVRDRQEQFGAVWEDVMSFALHLAGHRDISLTTQWEDPSPANERDVLENLRIKRDLGVPAEQILHEAGY
ncbi:MAG: phage portal protein [Pyrinomonadaceae bacterium]